MKYSKCKISRYTFLMQIVPQIRTVLIIIKRSMIKVAILYASNLYPCLSSYINSVAIAVGKHKLKYHN